MKISDLITELSQARDRHGDLVVLIPGYEDDDQFRDDVELRVQHVRMSNYASSGWHSSKDATHRKAATLV